MAITRNDVARKAGVSPGLVSYVLNGGPRPVSGEARARIEAAIRELGYRRDGVARQMKTGKSASIGLVLPDIALPYFAEITKELNARAFDADHQLLISTSEFDLSREQSQLESLAERRVDGIILMSVDPDQDFSVLTGLGSPVVVIDRPEFAIGSTRAATEHLIQHGHTKIGFIGGLFRASKRRIGGWAGALESAGVGRHDDWVISMPLTRAGGYLATQQLLQLPNRPTALLVESDAQACGALRSIHDLRLKVPEDVALITCEGTELAEFTVPSLSSLVQPISAIARDAVDTVLAEGPPGVRRVTNTEYRLVPRESCGHINALF
ncbi:LacI family DNA-binding transcriptional regulator [bacterium RCC_150]